MISVLIKFVEFIFNWFSKRINKLESKKYIQMKYISPLQLFYLIKAQNFIQSMSRSKKQKV